MTCQHKHCDNVKHIGWVCGKCYSILESRPKKYGMVKTTADQWRSDVPKFRERQDIIWQAEIKKSQCGTTLSKFIELVAKVFMMRTGMHEEESFRLALECLINLDEEFGVDYVDWSKSGAKDIADEEMSYWDDDGGDCEGNR